MTGAKKWLLSTILGFFAIVILLVLALFYSFDYKPRLEATRAIEKFHKLLNDGDFGQIQDEVGTHSNLGMSREDWTASIGKIRDSLGKFEVVKTSLIKCEAGPVFICRATLVSEFEKSETKEFFRFSRATGRMVLVEYSVLIEGKQFPPKKELRQAI